MKSSAVLTSLRSSRFPSRSLIGSVAGRTLATASFPPADPKSLDWATLGFAYVPTKSIIVTEYADGKWSQPTSSSEPFLRIHALSNVSIALRTGSNFY